MPISLQSQSSRLKRPRSNSQSESPSSSSPKRAASETDDPTEPGTSFLGRTMDLTNGVVRASSPLRSMEGDNAGEWVQRTEDVHLTEGEDTGNQKYKDLYDAFLGAIPPPFNQYEMYYIIPKSFKADLEALALSDDENTKSSSTDLQLDLRELVENVEGEELTVIETKENPDGSRGLAGTGKKEQYWIIKDGLSEDDDFLFIHEDGWAKIMECIVDYQGPKLPRFCLPGETIQLKPPIFTLYIVEPANTQSSTEAISSKVPLKFTCPTKTPLPVFTRLVRRLASGALGPNYETPIMRYWQLDLTNPTSESETLPALNSIILSHKLLPSLAGCAIPEPKSSNDQTVEDFGLVGGDGIVVEIGKLGPMEREIWAVDVNSDGKAIEKAPAQMPPVPTAPPPLFSKPALFGAVDSSSSGDQSGQGMATRSQSRQEKRGKGLVGLANLGNTCFMNSAVQCLSNTRELSEYFLSGVYTEELNVDNPLGMHGLIAKAFGMTIENLWTLVNQSFSPRILKGHTSRFAPQFAGYGQHDTQEFIAFLLDGLHEDLNRIIKKPYIEKPDWKAGGGDRQLAELGKECWDGYKKRNDSVIVDLFQGQLQSTLVCPECNKESITLDPFMYLTVPLPIAQHRIFKLRFVPRDPSQPPLRMKLLIPQNASFQKIKERIGSLLKVNPSHLVGIDQWHGSIYAWWYDSDHNLECKDHDEAVFYDVGVPVTTSKRSVGTIPSDGSVTVPVFTYKIHDPKHHTPNDCSLQPFFITLSKSEASDSTAVREAIMKGYQRFVKDSVKANLFVSPSSSHAAVPPPLDEEDEVTDIHIDEQAADGQDVEAPTTVQSQPHLSPTILQRKAGSSTSLSSMNSSRSFKTTKMVPRGDLFKVNVADASAGTDKGGLGGMFKSKDTTVQPLFKGSISDASKVFSPLENRLKIKKGMFNRFASGIGSIMSSSNPVSTADSEAENDSAPTTPNSPQPVIRPGEGIFVEWSVKRFNEYFDSAEELELVEDPAIDVESRKKKEGRVIGIEDCLDEFSKEETLGQDDLWYCPVCKKHQAATKKLEIYKAPDILVICIKRFGSSRRLSDKLDNLVNFPVEGLDLEDRVGERRIAKTLDLSDEECQKYDIEPSSEPLVYDLYAVDNHFGGLGGGHYTAFCKNKFDDQWYNYDDSRVSPATEKSIQSRAAYLLFYRRRAIRPIGGKSREKAEQASRAVSPAPSSLSGSASGSTSSGASPKPEPSNRLILRDESPEAESSPPTYSTVPSPPFASSDSSSDNGVVPDLYRSQYRSDSDGEADGEGESSRPSVDLATVGQGLGFGNTAWGTSTGFTRPSGDADVAETTTTTTNVESDSGSATSATEDLGDEDTERKKESSGSEEKADQV